MFIKPEEKVRIREEKINFMKNDKTAENVVETQELTKSFGADVAVQSLSMYVPRGKIFGFIGPSG